MNPVYPDFIWKTESPGLTTAIVDVDRKIFELLKAESRKADRVKSSFHAAAIVYRKRRVLAVGMNRRKSHPMMTKFGKEKAIFLHAEVDSIIRTINNYGTEILKECSIFVLRTTKAGNVGCSKPCSSCQSHIEHFQIPEVYWS